MSACSPAASAPPTTSSPPEAAPSATPVAEVITLRLGHVFPATSDWHTATLKFADLVKEKTAGRVAVQVFPNSELGSEREAFEGLQLGTIDMAFGGPGVQAGFDPKASLFDQPFLFSSYEHANLVMDGPIGKQVWDSMVASAGLHVLASGAQGFRYVLTRDRPIETITDISGQKIRVPEAPTFIKTFQAIGANPTPLAFDETYIGIQTGVVDGFEGVPEIILSSKLYEVGTYVARTNHILATLQLVISEPVYQSLSPDLQGAIEEAAIEAWREQRTAAEEGNGLAEKQLEELGVQFTDPDLAPFRDAVRPLWEEWAKEADAEDLLEAVLQGG